MRVVMVVAGVALLLGLAPPAGAQASLPMQLSVRYAGAGSGVVTVEGTTVPGTVVSVRGMSTVVSRTGKFTLRSALPLTFVGAKGGQMRRLTLTLPSGATKWLSRLTVIANLTKMSAKVYGAMTITNHPPATVLVRHVEAAKTIEAAVTAGRFGLAFPLVPRVNTLDWSLRAGLLTWKAPALSFTVL